MPDDYGDLAYSLAGVRRQSPFDRRRQMAYSFMQQGMDASPVQHPLQGAGRLAQALLGTWMSNRVDTDEKAAIDKQNTTLAAAMAEPDPQKRIAMLSAANPELGARLSGQLAVEQAKVDRQTAALSGGAGTLGMAYGQSAPDGQQVASAPPSGAPAGFANNVGNIRVSSATWDGKGQPHNGFETFGTPEQGAAAMFKNLQSYSQKNPQMTVGQAIATWAPPSENNTQAYVQRIAQAGINPNAPLAAVLSNPQVAGRLMMTMGMHEKGGLPAGFTPDTFVAAAGGGIPQGNNPQAAPGMPPAPSPQGVNAPTVSAPPSAPVYPEMQRAPPPAALVQKHQQILMQGGYGLGPEAVGRARAAIEAENDKLNADRHEAAKAQYQLQVGDYQAGRKQAMEQPQQNVQNESKIREQFDQLQSVKDYRKANTVFRSAVEASKVNSAAADLNMVYAFATLMDPGSVVRDSETGMVVATQNASDRVKAMVASVTGGSRLSPEARANILNEMASRYEAYKVAHDDLAKTFTGISERSGVNPQNVVVPYPGVEYTRPQVQQMPQAGSSASGPGTLPRVGANGEGYERLKKGDQYLAPDGTTRTKGGE